MSSIDKPAFAFAIALVGFALIETYRRSQQGHTLRELSCSDPATSKCHRDEQAIIWGKYGINPDLLSTKDLTIYPKKGDCRNVNSLSKAIMSITEAEDEYYYQNESIKKQLQPSNGKFLSREAVIEGDLVVPRVASIPDPSDINYEQVCLSKMKAVKNPIVKRHSYVPVYRDVRSQYFDPYASHFEQPANTEERKAMMNYENSIFNKSKVNK